MPDTPDDVRDDEGLRRLYAEATTDTGPHPSEDTLGGLLSGTLRDDERESTLEHVAVCGECSEIVQHVARCAECEPAYRASVPSPIKREGLAPRTSRLLRPTVLLPLAAAASLAVLASWFLTRSEDEPLVPETGPRIVASLRDGSRAVQLTEDGRLLGLSGLGQGLQQELAGSLRTGSLPLPADLGQLRGSESALRGSVEPQRFRAVAPVGVIARTDRPTFRWSALPGARRYVVSVFTEDLEPVTGSGNVSATEWTPSNPLPRGRTYVWQVASETPGGRQIAPAPPEPEARFHVLEADAAAALEQSLAAAHGSSLATGFLLARAGVLDEAETAFQALLESNPGSALAARLFEDVRRPRSDSTPTRPDPRD